jgi:4-hydroxy-tetrahydrodipicolinate synthase
MDGILVPLITPFDTDGALAPGPLEQLAHDVLDAGASGLVALGTTAEASSLDAGEKRTVVEVCARACRDRGAQLIVGAGTNDTRASVAALAALAHGPRPAAALVPVPYYTRPGEAGVLAHFAELAAASPVPIVLYHIPYRTGQALGAEALRTLGSLPRVFAVKYAVGGIDAETVDLLGDRPPGFAVLAGDDLYIGPMLALGAEGGILASAHLATEQFVALSVAWRKGDLETARRLGSALARWSGAAFAEPNPVVIKGVLAARGRIPSARVRLPLLPAARDSVDRALQHLSGRLSS